MALVKYGGGVIQMSGSIAGNTFARNRFGNYMRARTKPVNPRSMRQERAKAVVSLLAEYWHSDMNDTQRGLWDVYAAAVSMKNKLGETIHITGFNHFIRSNANMRVVGGGVTTAAPSILSLPEKDVLLQCDGEDIAAQTLSFACAVAGWAANGDPKRNIIIYQGQPQLASRTFFAGPWRYMGTVNAAEGAAGACNELAVFPFAEGQKVWFQARLVTESRRITNLWQLNPRTIEADGP